MSATDLPALALTELQALLRRREISPREVVTSLQTRLAKIDPSLGAYLSVDFETALREAAGADVTRPLGGVPIAIKDIISVARQPLTCGSQMLRDYRAVYDATVVKNLRVAGAIPLGKTNLDEFAMGSSTENSSFQLTRNPWDLSRVPGGSSGGSAAAVAAREAWGALGTDTGGSIRQPASFCGIVGLKPTYGRVSRYGLVAYASSLDQAGPLTRTVSDTALIFQALAGHDPLDSTSSPEPVPDYRALLGKDLRGVRFGRPREFQRDGIDPRVQLAVDAALRQLESLGAEIVEVSLPHIEYAISVYYLLATAEASTNLARFDGVRYGQRAAQPVDLLDQYRRTRATGFGDEVKRRIILGTYVLRSGYYEAYYQRAQKVRALLRQDFARAFKTVDAIVSPTAPTPAFKIGAHTEDPLSLYLADIFTNAANLAGLPGLSLPCGFAAEEGCTLPIGLQMLGRPFEEARLLQFGYAYEQSTEWHRRSPPLPVSASTTR